MNNLERKSFEVVIDTLDGETGEFEGYASVFNVVDLGGDRVLPGAFAKTIKEREGKIKLLWQHDRNKPIGVISELVEDETGLLIRGKLALKTQLGSETFELMKITAIDSFSIGYWATKVYFDEETGNRDLAEVELLEVSIVTMPMNEEATITQLKSQYDALSGKDKQEFEKSVNLQENMYNANEAPESEAKAADSTFKLLQKLQSTIVNF